MNKIHSGAIAVTLAFTLCGSPLAAAQSPLANLSSMSSESSLLSSLTGQPKTDSLRVANSYRATKEIAQRYEKDVRQRIESAGGTRSQEESNEAERLAYFVSDSRVFSDTAFPQGLKEMRGATYLEKRHAGLLTVDVLFVPTSGKTHSELQGPLEKQADKYGKGYRSGTQYGLAYVVTDEGFFFVSRVFVPF